MIPLDQLIITYQNKKLYPFGTPDSLRIYESANLKGYTITVWEKIQLMKREILERGGRETSVELGRKMGGEKEGEKRLRVTLRGALEFQLLPLRGKASIKISNLLKYFIKRFEIPKERGEGLWLEYEGKRLGMEMSLGEVEDFEEEEIFEVREKRD